MSVRVDACVCVAVRVRCVGCIWPIVGLGALLQKRKPLIDVALGVHASCVHVLCVLRFCGFPP